MQVFADVRPLRGTFKVPFFHIELRFLLMACRQIRTSPSSVRALFRMDTRLITLKGIV